MRNDTVPPTAHLPPKLRKAVEAFHLAAKLADVGFVALIFDEAGSQLLTTTNDYDPPGAFEFAVQVFDADLRELTTPRVEN